MRSDGRLRHLTCGGVLALLLLVGCGGESRSSEPITAKPDPTYEREMRILVSELAEVFAMHFGFMEVDNDEAAARLGRELADGYRRVSTRAEAVRPPDGLADEHAAFVDALDDAAEEWDAFAASGGKAMPAGDRVEASVERFDRPLRRIQSAGYDLNWK